MARLTAKRRRGLPASKFAIPGKRAYPIDTRRRAAAALGRVTQFGTPREKALVRKKVAARYGMGPAAKQ